MSTQIKNTLFRFVTMRAPELIEKEKVESGFVKHPESEKKLNEVFQSSYLEQIARNPEKNKNQLLKDVSKEYEVVALLKKESLLDNGLVRQNIYDFSIWLTKNRATLTLESLTKKITELGETEKIDNDSLIKLWDNLFFQIVTSQSAYLRDAILSVLVADFFLQNYTALKSEVALLRKLAQARVIMPKIVFGKTEITTTQNAKTAVSSRATIEQLTKEVETIKSNEKIALLNTATDELKRAQKAYQKENQIAYDAACKSHQQNVDEAYASATKVEKTIIDPETNAEKTIVEYENLNLPAFNFDKAAQLDTEALTNRVSTTTLKLVEKIVAENNYDCFDEVLNEVKQEVSTTTQTLFANNQLSQTIVSANGILLPVANTTNITNVFVLTNTGLNFNGTTSLQLLFSGIPNLENVVSSNYKLIIDNNPVPVEANSFQSEISNGKLAVKIFTNGIDLSVSKNIQLSGTFTLENDDKIVFSGNASITRSATRELISYTVSGKGTYELSLGNSGIGDNGNHSNNSLDYIPSGYGINRLGIADYRKVEQEVCCYVPGEVSHVENIMAREYKEKTTRRLRRTEDTTTTSKEQEIEKLTDTSTTDRFEMNQEVSSLLAEDTHQGAFVNAGYSNEAAGYSLNAGADFATNTTSEESNSQAVTHAKEITERALDRVVKKTKEERISKIIEEYSEENTHGFDNRKGDSHVSGVYRWIDKIYKNKVVNYGKRLMYEFMIPEPANFHNVASENSKNEKFNIILEKPIDPRKSKDNLILKLDSSFDENYKNWATKYNANVNPKPETKIKVGKSFTYGEHTLDIAKAETESIKIPDGYVSKEVQVVYKSYMSPAPTHVDNRWKRSYLIVGNVFRDINQGSLLSNTDGQFFPINDYRKEVPVSLSHVNVYITNISVSLICEMEDSYYKSWQIETFNTIIRAYEEKLAEYNAKLAELKSMQAEKAKTNPAFYRQIENMVLRKNCIEYLISQEALGKESLIAGSNVIDTRVKYDAPMLETYAGKVKFFEQAFEWNLMSYNFYPFYWASKENWASLYNINDIDDPTFRAFLQSGMARVILTVRPGFEEAVNWYMATGQVWNGGQVPTMDDELFVSIIEELRVKEGDVEETWESRVPTSLTVIQAGSIGLNVQGLPCNTDCDDHLLFGSDGNPIKQNVDTNGNDVVLGNSQNSTTTTDPDGLVGGARPIEEGAA
ncbi:hypothetical protein [Flavobacterium sp.]|uniref:hypothetical protein n=1 Tax=Flavobacterium sp. TaxID=239 RepID=UPI00404841A1